MPSTADRQPTRRAESPLTARRSPLAVGLALVALALPLMGAGGLLSTVALLCSAGAIAVAIAPQAKDSAGRLPVLAWLPASLPLALVPPTALGLLAATQELPI